MKQRDGYLLGIGSNINPYDNIAAIISGLLQHFGQLTLSRILTIPPVGMNSHRDFLNAAAFIETDITRSELKAICNHIEIDLGRDRDDPLSKTKDRPADLDILCALHLPQDAGMTVHTITDEYFLYPVLHELMAFLTNTPLQSPPPAGVLITTADLRFGETAATIYWNRRASHKRVVQQTFDR